MPANRFFYPDQLAIGSTIILKDSEHHHMRVMRIEVGEEVEIINGMGALGLAKVIAMLKDSTQLSLKEVQQALPLTQQIILVIPLMRPNKLEWIVEKGTELGANAFHFYAADFSEKMQLSTNQLERLHNLCLSALKQSGSLFIPSLELLPSLQRALIEDGTYYFGDTRETSKSILDVECGKRTALITGPERGFSPAENELLGKKAQGVTLSKNILRAETAPIVGLSVLGLKLD